MNLFVPIYICFILSALSFYPSRCTTLQKASNIDARNVVLYNATSTAMSNQQFSINFGSNFSAVPLLVYGINNYKMKNQFYYQNFDSVQSALSVSTFSVNVTTVGLTGVLIFSISYIAFEMETSFLSDFKSFTNV
jgi:hypothetical protein